MTSTTFFHELKETYGWVLKKNRGVLILLAVLMFLSGPLIFLIGAANQPTSTAQSGLSQTELFQQKQIFAQSFLLYAPVASMILILIFSAVLCVMLFGYMHNKRSVDLFHSLPVRREALLLGRWCAGLTILWIPLLANFLLLFLLLTCYGMGINVWSVFSPMLWCMLMGTAAFTSCMLMAVCSGTMLDTALSVIGINAGYPLLILCTTILINMLLPGANIDYEQHIFILSALAPFAAWVSPILKLGYSFPWFLLWWIFLTLVMLCGAVVLYKKRKSESAENSLAFPLPKILIRFLLTAVGGMGFGLMVGNENTLTFFVGLAAGSVIAHTVVECIYSRGFQQLRKSFEWYGVFAVAFILFYGIVVTGCFGYDTRLPSADEVTSVTVSTNFHEGYDGYGCNVIYDQNNRRLKALTPLLSEPDSIKTVLKIHENIIQVRRSSGYPYQMHGRISTAATLTYHLKNGKSFTRTYNLYEWNDKVLQTIQPIYELEEYTDGLDMIFMLEPQDIKGIEVKTPGRAFSSGKAVIPEDAQKEELLAALRQDIRNKKVNYDADSQNDPLLTLQLDFYNNLTPKNKKLKTILGDYKGKINLIGDNNYNIYDKSSAVYELLKKYGWT